MVGDVVPGRGVVVGIEHVGDVDGRTFRAVFKSELGDVIRSRRYHDDDEVEVR